MATLAELERKKRDLKKEKERYQNLKDGIEDKIDQAKKRRKKLESMLNDLKWDFDGNVRTTNRHADSIDSNMEDAIKGSKIVNTIGSIVQGDKEKDTEKDPDLKNAMSELTQEINALERYEEESKTTKSSYSRKINSINSQLWDVNLEISKKKLTGEN